MINIKRNTKWNNFQMLQDIFFISYTYKFTKTDQNTLGSNGHFNPLKP